MLSKLFQPAYFMFLEQFSNSGIKKIIITKGVVHLLRTHISQIFFIQKKSYVIIWVYPGGRRSKKCLKEKIKFMI